jgi:hypothetical protein
LDYETEPALLLSDSPAAGGANRPLTSDFLLSLEYFLQLLVQGIYLPKDLVLPGIQLFEQRTVVRGGICHREYQLAGNPKGRSCGKKSRLHTIRIGILRIAN